jgi:hypothetical protein
VQRLEDDGLPGVDAHVVRLAADGLWAADLFNLAPPDPALRARIHARLAELAGASGGQWSCVRCGSPGPPQEVSVRAPAPL